MSDKPQWVKGLEAQPCECIKCPCCNGDLAELEDCEVCSNGILETCPRCAQLEQYEFEQIGFI
jgi:hypothetical protein